MKKKILSLLLMICMVFPSIFMVGCGEDPVALGGKTLIATTIEEVDWDSTESPIKGEYLDNSTYTSYTYTFNSINEFLYQFGNAEDASGERVIDWGNYSDDDIDDIADQKAIISKNIFKALTFDGNKPVFSSTAEKLYIYDASKSTILHTFTIKTEKDSRYEYYKAYDGDKLMVTFVYEDEEKIYRRNASSEVFEVSYILPLNPNCQLTMSAFITDEHGNTITAPAKVYDLFRGKIVIPANLVYEVEL